MRTQNAASLSCRNCQYFVDDPFALEREFPGIGALSSTLGSTRGEAGICRVLAVFHDPHAVCAAFQPREQSR